MKVLRSGLLAVATAAAIGTAAPVSAQEAATIAIRNARIVPVSGPTIESGTIVLSGGLIRAIGARVDIPADAAVIDGTGLNVYPGLIDAMTDFGLGGTPQGPGGAAGGGSRTAPTPSRAARGPQDRPASTPWVQAADEFRPDARRLETWRNGGFTSLVVAPSSGIFPGQAAVVNLSGAERGEAVVRPRVALPIGLRPQGGFASFPGSLMGVIAYVRQVFSDTRHYGQLARAYDASPRGRTRPEYDRTVLALHEALSAKVPVLLPAVDAPAIDRVLRLAQELEVSPVIYGAHDAGSAATRLAQGKVPVLVSTKWPEQAKDADPDAPELLQVLELRERAPSTPAALAAQKVTFAFYADGVSAPKDALANVRKAIDAGLSRDAALRAMTLDVARIYGVGDRLGSLETGKIANVIVTKGDVFDRDATFTHVFVDGIRFDVPPAPLTNDRSEGASATASARLDGGPISIGAAATAQPAGQVTVIRNATIFTVSGEVIDGGSVVIRNGRIAAVGASVDVPRGATEIDATGKFVTPGIIDAHSHIAVEGSVNEGSMSVTSMVGIEDVLNPTDIDIYRGLAGGVTTANVLHGSANAIGGKNAVIKLRWGHDARGLLFEGAPPGIKFALGENPKRSNRSQSAGEARYPATRMGVMDVIREAFVDARDYQARRRRYEAAVKAGDRTATPPARDLTLEPLVEILEGRRLVHAHAYRADEILQLLRVAEEFDFKIATLQHVLEGYKVADEIARHGAGASTFSDWWAYKIEAFDAIPHNAALMAERGVLVSINSDSAEEHRHLNQEAAKAIKYGGMSEAEALKLVTLNPARQLGIDKRVGSIEVGKDADLVVFSAHPLSVYAVPELVLIDGVVYFDRDKDLAQRESRAQRKLTLQRKDAPAGKGRPTTADGEPRQTTPRSEQGGGR